MDPGLRYFGGFLAFGFAAVWIVWSLTAALVCLLSAAAGYGAVYMAQETLAKLAARSSSHSGSGPSNLALRADELNKDLGHLYEPIPTSSQPGGEKPSTDAPASQSETPPQK